MIDQKLILLFLSLPFKLSLMRVLYRVLWFHESLRWLPVCSLDFPTGVNFCGGRKNEQNVKWKKVLRLCQLSHCVFFGWKFYSIYLRSMPPVVFTALKHRVLTLCDLLYDNNNRFAFSRGEDVVTLACYFEVHTGLTNILHNFDEVLGATVFLTLSWFPDLTTVE